MKKIGILTFHRSINYGAFMQCLALSHSLQQRFPDCKVEVIDYESRIMHEHYIPKFSLSYIKHPKLFSQTKKKYTAFQSVLKFLPLSDKTFISDGDDEALYEYIKANYDAVVVGSDAVWNWIKRGFPNPYLLAKPDGIKKFSYAASAYGMKPECITPEQKEYFGSALDGFDFIGVRDEYTRSLVQGVHGDKNLCYTCDPTVLLDLEYVASLLGTDYNSYIASVKKKYALPEDKVLVGVMDSSADAAAAIKAKYGEKVYTVALYVYNSAADKFISDINPLEWSLIFGAFDVTVTNYFHGTHLSLKNKTPVIAIDRTEFSIQNEGKIHDVLRRAGLLDCYFNGNSTGDDIVAKFDEILAGRTSYIERIENGFEALAESSEIFFKCMAGRELEQDTVGSFEVTVKTPEPQTGAADGRLRILEREGMCTGCALCADVCPKGAITMQAKPDGFKYPVIDGEACIHCNLCKKKCPVLQPKKKIEPLEAFALRDKCESDRLKSASGGAATLFMKKTLESGGICSGVVLNKEFEAVHELCESESALDAFRDSKYIQSDTNGIYKKIETALKEKPLVLVVGLPCQIAAVRSRFGERDNLVLCDLICHGAPSPLILKKNIELLEHQRGCKVTGFLFRDKTNGWQKSNVKVSFDDGSSAVYERKDSEFFRLFGQNLILRPSCGDCTFKGFNISSDITLGDYWGIEKRFPELNDDKGCSLVMVNTPRGKEFFDGIKDCADCVDTGVDFAVETHPKLIKSVQRNPYSASFFKALNKNVSPAHFKKTADIFCSQDIINKVIKKFISR